MKTKKIILILLAFAQSAISQNVVIPALQTVNYKYHIRGGLLGINLDNSNKPVPNYSEGDLFSYKLDYETVGMYNGNVGKQTWARTSVLLEPCKIDTNSYTFTYDPAQRLTAATYIGQGDFSLPLISYDKNSNITGLKRNGWLGGSHGLIDNLSYTYSGNQLTKVTDVVSGSHAVDLDPKLNGARTYYEDGSLKSDENKAITKIEYDPFLMLPTRIELTNNRWINMGYTMDGELEVREYSSGETWVYASGMTFLNGQPYSMPIPEGRAMYTAGSWKNEFFITDHLGNVRVTFAEENGQLKPKDFADYDPTGIEMQGNYLSSGTYKFDPTKFQDKESLSSKFGLSGLNDFGPRMLDKTLGGIFSQPDILGELNESASPFSYLNGRYLNMVDPTGMLSMSSSSGTRDQTGADGLTDEEWMENSKPKNTDNPSTGNPSLIKSDNTNVSSFRFQTVNPNQGPQYQGSQSTLKAPLTADEYRKKYDPAYDYSEAKLTGYLVELAGLKKLGSYVLKNAKSWFKIGSETKNISTALVTKYPSVAEIANTSERTYLMPGDIIDRYGSISGKWFSTPNTSYGARSIPPGLSPYSKFKVLKPIEINKSLSSSGMFSGQTGFGVQYQTPVSLKVLLKRKLITPF